MPYSAEQYIDFTQDSSCLVFAKTSDIPYLSKHSPKSLLTTKVRGSQNHDSSLVPSNKDQRLDPADSRPWSPAFCRRPGSAGVGRPTWCLITFTAPPSRSLNKSGFLQEALLVFASHNYTLYGALLSQNGSLGASLSNLDPSSVSPAGSPHRRLQPPLHVQRIARDECWEATKSRQHERYHELNATAGEGTRAATEGEVVAC